MSKGKTAEDVADELAVYSRRNIGAVALKVAIERALTAYATAYAEERVKAVAEYAATAVRAEALEEAALHHASVSAACDHERAEGHPGGGAMGAIIEYRDLIRALKEKP